MNAEVTFKQPVFQRLHEILDHLETEFDVQFLITHKANPVPAEEVVKEIAAQLEVDDLCVLAKNLGMSG